MARTLLNGAEQIASGTVPWSAMASGAIVPTTSLVDGADFVKRTGTVAMTAALNMNSQLINNLSAGVSAGDAVNKGQLDALKAGFQLHYAEVVAVANIASLSGLPTIDGDTLVDGEIALLTAQTTGSQNGPWAVHSGAWTRPTDWASGAVKAEGQYFIIQAEGTTYKNTKWFCTNTGPVTVDTTAATFVQDSSGTSYSNGTGLSLTGTVFAVKYGNGVAADGSNNVAAVGDSTRAIQVTSSGIGLTDPTAGQILIGSATPKAVWASMSGDATINSSGALSINVTAGSGFLKYGSHVWNETPSGTINGSNTSFTLANTPANTSTALMLFLNGIIMEPGSGNDFTISGATITMLFAPASGDKLRAYYVK